MKNRQLTQQQIRAYAHYLQMEEKSGANHGEISAGYPGVCLLA